MSFKNDLFIIIFHSNARDNLTGEILQVKTLEKNIGEKDEVIKDLQGILFRI